MGGYVGIPTSYTPVEYIESSGTQYIDTGVSASATLKTLCDMSTTTGGYPFGVTPAQNVKYYGASVSTTNQRIQSYFGTTSSYATTNNVWTKGQRFVLTANDNYKFYKDSTQIADYTTGTTKEFDNSLSITIFALNGLYLSSRITMKLYGFKMYDDGTLIRDFIPVKVNGVGALYDQVENKLYYNAGGGNFAVGSDTGEPVYVGDKARKIKKAYVGIPMSYTPVEYIESSGTQYIDTGFEPNQNTNMQIDFQYFGQNSQVSTATSICIAGARQIAASNKLAFWVERDTSKVALNYGTYDSGFVNNTDCSQRTTLKNQGCSLLYNGATVASSTSSDFTSIYNILLFGLSSSDGSADLRGVKMKLYSFKIWDNNTLARDFIPAVDQDGVACLYDQVEGKLYCNKGTGTFTAGNTTGEPVYLGNFARKIKRGYVGVNGVARLCFGSITPALSMTVAGNDNQKVQPNVAGTTSYVLIAGGCQSGGNPVKTTIAYNGSGVATNAADLPVQSKDGTATNFNGYAIIAGGKIASGGSSRTNQCIAYSDNLTNQTLTTLYDTVFAPASAATSNHFMVAGGCNYSQWLRYICSYNTSFVKTFPSDMSIKRDNHSLAAIDQYIVCCGGHDTYGAVDFYDNSNVKTTVTNPYGSKGTNHTLGLTTKSYAIFFGGGSNDSTPYADCKAYDKNKVLTSFTAPISLIRSQGFSNGDYACVFYNSNELIYDDNLVLIDNISGGSWSSAEGKVANANETLGLVRPDSSANVYLFTM